MSNILKSLPELSKFSLHELDCFLGSIDELSRMSGDLAVKVYSNSSSEMREKVQVSKIDVITQHVFSSAWILPTLPKIFELYSFSPFKCQILRIFHDCAKEKSWISHQN